MFMTQILNSVLVAVLVLNLFALGSSRILSVIHIVAAQGILLGIIPLLLHDPPSLPSALAACAAVLLKGLVIPAIMIRSLRSARIKREFEPFIGLLPSVLLGAAATGFALLISKKLPLASDDGLLIIPAAMSTIAAGFIILITRYKALSQTLGYLVMENGIFIFGMLLVEAVPFVVEMGMLLDLFVGIFVISIITNHINRAFSSMDTRNLVSLKEE
jgi:hydrogenase-4 component E